MSILVKSLTDPSRQYEIDYEDLTCTCSYWLAHCYLYRKDDPHRLCKHLTRVVADKGAPPDLEPFKGRIEWCAFRAIRYMSENTATKKFKEPLGPGTVKTSLADRGKRYLHLMGIADEKLIRATVTLSDGTASFQIVNAWGTYNPITGESAFPKAYRYMKAGITFWIDSEYNKVKN